jgi:hypothetical protein
MLTQAALRRRVNHIDEVRMKCGFSADNVQGPHPKGYELFKHDFEIVERHIG